MSDELLAPPRRPRPHPKGRQLDETALAEVRALLADPPSRRDLLIEHLHAINDRFGHLSARHLKALAEAMRLSEAEVFEVASFYHHFTIVKDGESAPPMLSVRVCDGIACALAGAERLLADLQSRIDPVKARLVRAPCLGRCAESPVATIGWRPVERADGDAVVAALADGRLLPDPPASLDLAGYRAGGGYGVLAECLAGRRTRDEVIAALSDADLRGLGGAGFPAGRKWGIVRNYPGPRYVTVNIDEGEPGTFKDRWHIERDPHGLLEGALIAAWAIEATRVYLYMRDEYPHLHALLREEIAAIERAGLAPVPIELRRGAGAYICGEESAMIESIEGKRGLPRHRPPFIAERGLFDRPTLNHNAETLIFVRAILENGPGWFAAQGRRGAKGLRSFSVSGQVRDPGVKLAPAGVTARELVEEFAGGMRAGHRFAAYLPGGASGGILPARLADLPLDFGSLDAYGCFVGSHAVVILSDKDDVRAVALNLVRFFAHESCGQCTPCRAGTEKLVALIERGIWDGSLMGDLEAVMRDASICGLGQAAPNPVRSVLRFFGDDR